MRTAHVARIRKLAAFVIVLAASFFAGAISSSQPSTVGDEAVRLDPKNPHYFLYRGKAIALITSGEHYGAVINEDFDYHRYLSTLAELGFNYTRVFTGSYVEVPGKSFGIQRNDIAPAPGRFLAPWARSGEAGYAGGGNKFDLTQWNSHYFDRLHDFLAEAAKNGIVVEITLFSSTYGSLQWSFSPFHPGNNINHTDTIDWHNLNTLDNGNILRFQEQFVRKIVREATPYSNVILEIQNEPWSDRGRPAGVVNPYLPDPARDQFPNSIELADAASLAWQLHVVKWIKTEESYAPAGHIEHLIAEDCCNFRSPIPSVLGGVSIVNFHYAYPEAVSLNYGLDLPLSYDETGFLGRDDDAYIRQAWEFMLAGGSAFDNLDYSFTVGHEDGSDAESNGPGGGSPEFRRRLKILADFLRDLPLEGMKPYPFAGGSAPGLNVYALSNGEGESAFYLDGSGPAIFTLHRLPGEYRASWTRTDTGETSSETISNSGAELKIATPEFKGGIALRLIREHQ